jgi:thiamine phosphate synthase YjbQ (UPF0047 family)
VATEITLDLVPRGRFDLIDAAQRCDSEQRDLRRRHSCALYSSLHTTAGFLGPRFAARVTRHRAQLHGFFRVFRTLFPPGGDYRHDQMHLRQELNDAQREKEPRNGDSHLTFIGSGMTNCATHANRPPRPVYFIDLDGECDGQRRRRRARVLGYDHERVVAEEVILVPVSRHPIDSVNLADPRFGFLEQIEDMMARSGLEKGRVDLALHAEERDSGLTVNEYETLLMRHDLAEVLRDPLRFAAQKGRHMLEAPLAIPGKTLNYARYDVVQVFNTLMEALHISESAVERLIAQFMAVPARRLLRSRRVSFLASDQAGEGRARLVRGTYQSPILVQWKPSRDAVRRIHLRLVRLS